MNPSVCVPIADGSEEIEAMCIVDVLRRANANVTVASVGDALQVTMSRGVKVVADARIADCENSTYDLIALPGGMPGAENLRDSAPLTQMLKNQQQAGRLYAAICASPAVVLAAHGLLSDKKATCYPGFNEALPHPAPALDTVVVDGNCITSQGPGTALSFSLALVAALYDPAKADEIAAALLMKR